MIAVFLSYLKKKINGINFHRYMHSADYAVARCLSVRLSHAGIESKQL